MKLFYSPGACSLAPHIVLEEMGVPHELQKVDLRNKSPEFVQLNPKGYVPAVVTDEGKLLTEASVILQYVSDLHPGKKLLPQFGTWERYKAMEMLNYISTEVHKGFGPLWGAERMLPEQKGAQDILRQTAVAALGKKFDFLSEKLQKHPFLLGEQFTACDAYLFTILGWTRFLKVDMAKWPVLMGYVERIQQRPAVQTAMKAEGILK